MCAKWFICVFCASPNMSFKITAQPTKKVGIGNITLVILVGYNNTLTITSVAIAPLAPTLELNGAPIKKNSIKFEIIDASTPPEINM